MVFKGSLESALFCVLLLSEVDEGQTLSSSALARYFNLSPSYLLKVLKPLVKHGILASYLGKSGGYRIDRDLTELNLLDLIEAVDPNHQIQFRLECLEASKASSSSNCGLPVSNRVELAFSKFAIELGAINLASLVNDRKERESKNVSAYRRTFVRKYQRELLSVEGGYMPSTIDRYRATRGC